MDFTPADLFPPGMRREKTLTVSEEHSAAHVGSGSLRVLATPWMIAYMEQVSRDLLAEALPAGFSSVGVHVDVCHLAPTPVGSPVTVRAEVLAVDGRQVSLRVWAEDAVEPVGEGRHVRAVIDEARFLKRVAAKLNG